MSVVCLLQLCLLITKLGCTASQPNTASVVHHKWSGRSVPDQSYRPWSPLRERDGGVWWWWCCLAAGAVWHTPLLHYSTPLQVNAVPRQDLPPFWVIVMRPTSSVYKWVKDRNYLVLFGFCLFQSILTLYFVFRMRAKTSEFLKVLNRAKIEEENTKKKTSFMGNRGQFI